ncbi:aminotransferase class I/II-fold pyridoxal phosphate-dependent enzyme [Pedobacter sp. HMF7647]|uniref:Aminotransferase class I/II-fold pyridoxal phosphate-dependent enzyme n=1 Tax=Hufsiella arboris TaxID=2695275 RepID=A0A7K1Y7S7_9SPHI|nr:aminotransferase class I/II-fold pyridoxal phosphate-dependent enzyme [Hufsiella arboris]
MDIVQQFHQKLQARDKDGLLRSLPPETGLIDFCSNDYLGFSRSPELKRILNEQTNLHSYQIGSTGSRLISGNTTFAEDLETFIAEFHESKAALLFNSGYDANVGLFSCIAQRNDTIISDELIHASIIDGIRLSHATRYTFRHNDLNSLESKLKIAKGNIFIAVESVYSMDGDLSPLKEISALANRYNAALIVDEAHAAGVFGHEGRGLVHELNMQQDVFARVITFGKAFGTHGAAVLGSKTLQLYLINFARSFIYTTAQSFHNLLSIRAAYTFLQMFNHQELIHQRVSIFNKLLKLNDIDSRSPIKKVIIGGNEKTKMLASDLKKQGFDVRAILAPTVPAGMERLRICIHTHNTHSEIEQLTTAIVNYQNL